ncbi:MAG: ferritin-like domain-containing protein [Tepidisphaeraceae bacterium]|jgi:ferritin-like metal-binding protein YciE
MESLSDLMEDELKDLYSAENQLLKALPKMAKKASSSQLKTAFTNHLKETEGHVKRLQQIGKILDINLGGKVCQAMQGLIEEGGEALDNDGPPAVVDSALIGAARRVEHYEMAAYCATRGMAIELGNDPVAQLLEQTTNEEEAADNKLKSIAQDEVFPHAAAESQEAGEAEKTEKSTKRSSK